MFYLHLTLNSVAPPLHSLPQKNKIVTLIFKVIEYYTELSVIMKTRKLLIKNWNYTTPDAVGKVKIEYKIQMKTLKPHDIGKPTHPTQPN